MEFIFINTVFFPTIWLSRRLFGKIFNPLSLYAVIWYFMLTFYNLRLINYVNLSFETWNVIFLSFLALFLGILTYATAKNSLNNSSEKQITQKKELPIILRNDGKILFWLTIVFGTIGLFSAIQTWFVVMNKYNSVIELLLHLGRIYQMRVSGELEGIIPYLSLFTFSAIFFSAIYSAYHKRIKLVSLYPLTALIIKQVALAGRASILLGFLEYVIAFIFMLYFMNDKKLLPNKKNIVIYFQALALILLFVFTIVAIKNLRGATENYTGATLTMKKFEDSPFLSPSIYLYLTGHVGVLNKFLEKDDEKSRIGENSLQFLYNLLSKFKVVEKPKGYQKGYYIPLWINTGTFIRELIADYSLPGTLVFLFLLGFLIMFTWHNFYFNNNIISLVVLVFLTLIIGMSFLQIVTRLANWVLSFIFIILTLSIINHFSYKRETV